MTSKIKKKYIWIETRSNIVTIGLTSRCIKRLGGIIRVHLPQRGEEYELEDGCGIIEGKNKVIEIYSPVSGTVVDINSNVSTIEKNCDKEGGWIFKMKL